MIDIRSVGVHHVTMMMNANREGGHRDMKRTIDMILETDVEIHVIAGMMIEDTMIVDMATVDMTIVAIMIVLRIVEGNHLVTEDPATEEIRIQEAEILVIGLPTKETLAIKVHDQDLTPVVDRPEIESESCPTLMTRVEIIIHLQCWAAN